MGNSRDLLPALYIWIFFDEKMQSPDNGLK